jgi:hypothetical protein
MLNVDSFPVHCPHATRERKKKKEKDQCMEHACTVLRYNGLGTTSKFYTMPPAATVSQGPLRHEETQYLGIDLI